ncbi:hypothetical protein SEA_LAKSHMI_60 [Arthrobacter phage Lakshmi]|uniref:HNH endonuclease n=1 Tax=Arthrobacter phage Lakshmi TaxID=3062829 RepID=A0AB38YBK6_9CAUD|nr:hypothetical protein SEA_LAKSHMI_60 [Arthrobacter phage Lakshmi]
MQATPEVKTRPVLPHTFGRTNISGMNRAEKREFLRSLRKKGRPYKVQPKRTKGKG